MNWCRISFYQSAGNRTADEGAVTVRQRTVISRCRLEENVTQLKRNSSFLFRRILACLLTNSRWCHSSLVVLDEMYRRMKSIDSGLLALCQPLQNAGPATHCGSHRDTRAHTHTLQHTNALLTPDLYRKQSAD